MDLDATIKGLPVNEDSLLQIFTEICAVEIDDGITFNLKRAEAIRKNDVLAYNLETILAEKLETIISRGDQNTRPRDFYDVFI